MNNNCLKLQFNEHSPFYVSFSMYFGLSAAALTKTVFVLLLVCCEGGKAGGTPPEKGNERALQV